MRVVMLMPGSLNVVRTSNGDIISLKYNGQECQDQSKFTHISSGLRSATVASNVSGDYATATIKTATLTQYYVAVKGQSTIYIGTYITAEPTIGELRFIARLNKSVLSQGPQRSEVAGGSIIEGKDVMTVNGQTRSKFYSSVRFINNGVYGVNGSGIGTSQQEVYFYMNSGHMKTEEFRTGFFGPYALVFNSSGTPPSTTPDTSFFAKLGLTGYVAASDRGTVTGSCCPVWSMVSSGNYTLSEVNPGTYTATLFKEDLSVGTGTVTVSAGKTATLDIKSAEDIQSTLWQIGVPDGTPAGFLNADKITSMHPFTFLSLPLDSYCISVDYPIPAGTLVEGLNTFAITVINGNSVKWFLSANIMYDSVELY
ncbi:putative rhamnogalacturonate lyase A [Rhizoctonia solani]|uniref:rhamnogalacturonan endolyase n=1 Tax=Rhizoctonia solani TaxID=456999 RepID=A0A0K6G6Z6_9AGAM|nr:putative rhamnogalacturonate lyase A [Rhizoctonia solani]